MNSVKLNSEGSQQWWAGISASSSRSLPLSPSAEWESWFWHTLPECRRWKVFFWEDWSQGTMYVQPSRNLPGIVTCLVTRVTVVPGMVPKSWPHSLLKEDSDKPSPERGASCQVPEAVEKDVSFVGGTLGWMDLQAGAVAETSVLFGPHLKVMPVS